MKVKVLANFRDRENDLKLRKAGEQLEISKDRAAKLAGLGLVEIVSDMQPEKKG